MPQDDDIRLEGPLWLHRHGVPWAGQERIELLRAIETTGSIAAAARIRGISWKAAWDAIDAMNNLAPTPLVERKAGGRHGGGTRLTPDGARLIQAYDGAALKYRYFLDRLSDGIRAFDHVRPLLGGFPIKTSARNLLRGTVTHVDEGAVNTEVTLDLNGQPLVAMVTVEGWHDLELAPGDEALALIKAPWVILTTADGGLKTSVRNRLCGTVERRADGAVNTEIVLALEGGKRLVAMITTESANALALNAGEPACALIKPANIILAVPEA